MSHVASTPKRKKRPEEHRGIPGRRPEPRAELRRGRVEVPS
ncbi:hypothetical protein WMF11_37370 [Sorangium sp. So ce295]